MTEEESIDTVREALHASVERFRFLAETIPVQVWTSLPNGQLDFVTEQTARHFGLQAATILRDGWKDVVHPDDLERVGARWMQSLSTGEPYDVQFRVKLADGSWAWHLVRAVPQRGPDGQIMRWYGSNTNIEEERESQRRVQAVLDELTAQAKEYQNAVTSLRAELAAAKAKIAVLEGSK